MSEERETLLSMAEARALYRDLGPQGDALEQLLARTEARIAEASAQSAPASGSPPRLLLKWLAGATLVIGAASLLWLRDEPTPARAPTATQPAASVAQAPAEPPASLDLGQPVPTAQPAPQSPVESAPRPEGKRARSARKAQPATTTEASDPIAELSLLTRARRVLLSDPARSLTLCEEHARDYPHGALTEERELLAIEALSNLREEKVLAARAARFARSFPSSVHLTRVREIVSAFGKSSSSKSPTEAR